MKCPHHGCDLKQLFTSVYCEECELEVAEDPALLKRQMLAELKSYRRFGITERAVERIKEWMRAGSLGIAEAAELLGVHVSFAEDWSRS